MTTPLYALMGFVFWTLLLLVGIAVFRVGAVLRGEAAPTSFTAGVPHGGEMYWRLNRAHLNCLENLPLVASVILTGYVIGLESATFDTLARALVMARVGQSIAHVSSGAVTAINVRFGFFIVQFVCLVWMALLIVG